MFFSLLFNKASYSVGTPAIILGLYFFNRFPNSVALKAGCIIAVAPK